jgi:hypothetical protein
LPFPTPNTYEHLLARGFGNASVNGVVGHFVADLRFGGRLGHGILLIVAGRILDRRWLMKIMRREWLRSR